jgi:hypothetical protein
MLQTQVNYWQLKENQRHNQQTEEQAARELVETNRHNLATEEQQARQATAALKQAASAAKNANTNLFIARYNRDLGYKNLAVSRRNADSNAKQAQAALRNAESNALQASASWKNALTNAYAAEKNAQYQQGMLSVAKFNAKIAEDRNSWERDAQSIRNLTEQSRKSELQSQAALNWQGIVESQSRVKSNTYLNELRVSQKNLADVQQYAIPFQTGNDSIRSVSSFIDAILPF